MCGVLVLRKSVLGNSFVIRLLLGLELQLERQGTISIGLALPTVSTVTVNDNGMNDERDLEQEAVNMLAETIHIGFKMEDLQFQGADTAGRCKDRTVDKIIPFKITARVAVVVTAIL